MTIDRAIFFDRIRKSPFPGKMTQGQVKGCEAILDEWERRGLTDLRWLAYMLATTKGETAHTMRPIKERGGAAYFKKMYDIEGDRPALARQGGNVNPGDGSRYCGRGYVQLTWRNNYRAMGKLIGAPLEDQPELALRPDIAAQIMFEGMTRGTFTGKKLADYFSDKKTDWRNARRIINGTDRAAYYADTAEQFHAALSAAKSGAPTPQKKPKTVTPAASSAGAVAAIAAVAGGAGGLPWWQVALIAAGCAVAAFTAIYFIRRKK